MSWIDEINSVPADLLDAIQHRSVMISAGHSETDPGAVANDYTEADIVLAFRRMLVTALRRRGMTVMVDASSAVNNLPLRQAVVLAAQADIAIELHCNAAGPVASGVETLSRLVDFPLAERLCAAVAEVLDVPNRGAKPEFAGQHHRLAFVSTGGGIILELFFLSNPRDLAAFLDRRTQLAAALADLIAYAARQTNASFLL